MRKQQQKKNKSPTPRRASAQLATGLARPPSRPTWPGPPTHSVNPPPDRNPSRRPTPPPLPTTAATPPPPHSRSGRGPIPSPPTQPPRRRRIASSASTAPTPSSLVPAPRPAPRRRPGSAGRRARAPHRPATLLRCTSRSPVTAPSLTPVPRPPFSLDLAVALHLASSSPSCASPSSPIWMRHHPSTSPEATTSGPPRRTASSPPIVPVFLLHERSCSASSRRPRHLPEHTAFPLQLPCEEPPSYPPFPPPVRPPFATPSRARAHRRTRSPRSPSRLRPAQCLRSPCLDRRPARPYRPDQPPRSPRSPRRPRPPLAAIAADCNRRRLHWPGRAPKRAGAHTPVTRSPVAVWPPGHRQVGPSP